LIELQQGDAAAAAELWGRYFDRLTRLARRKLADMPRRAADEEDVALSAFGSFCRAAEARRFPRLEDRNDLWQVLVMLAARKAASLGRHLGRQKRGGARLRGHSVFGLDGSCDGFEQIIGAEPSPELAALVAEQFSALIERLDDATLRDVAIWKMEGYSNEEIAAKLGRQTRTVERKLRLIRKRWAEAAPDNEDDS
jgi:DNA-directed RNA polymerase specialized sigma24 family protein